MGMKRKNQYTKPAEGIHNPLQSFLVDRELFLSLYSFARKANPFAKAACRIDARVEYCITIAIEV
jgi:hypothetical protein